MSLKVFIKERLGFIITNFILFLIVGTIMWIVGVSKTLITLFFLGWFLPVTIAYGLEFFQRKSYYNGLLMKIEKLDQKYLLSEVIEEPEFQEGHILFDVLKETNKQMHEHINEYKGMQLEYREYIETWVHEVKTPIASGKLILDNNKSEISRGVYEELDKVEALVEQALYYARSNDVSKDYIVKEFPLKNAVNQALRKNVKGFMNKKIELKLGDINDVVYSDIKWVEFILNQVLVNAINYSEGTYRCIEVYTSKRENGLVLMIKDHGVGIDVRDLARVFEKGFTGENGRIYGKSTGMGLYLCKKLALKLHLGLELKSEVGKGTEVHIIFPKSKVLLLES